MTFQEFKDKYEKEPVVEYKNQRQGKIPLVTVKVLTYNHEGFIEQCLESLVHQETSFDFEILIGEDESADDTRTKCITYAEKYPDKIRLLLNSRKNNIKVNGKPTGLFNNAFVNYNIKSKYVCILEGDDYWTDNTSLQKRFDFMEANPDYSVCFHNISRLEGETLLHPEGVLRYKQPTTIESKDMINTYMPTNTLMFRNGISIVYDDSLKGILCLDMVTRAMLSQAGKAMFLPGIGNAVYRIHQGGIFSSQNMAARAEHALIANAYIAKVFKEREMDVNSANNSWIEAYVIQFMNTLTQAKSINLSLLNRGRKKAKELEVSFLSILKGYISSRIKSFTAN